MDLVSSPDQTKIIVVTDHCDKKGKSKIVAKCSLPLTGARCVSLIVTDLVSIRSESLLELMETCQAVFDVDRIDGTLTLRELMPGATLEEVRAKTDARFEVREDLMESPI